MRAQRLPQGFRLFRGRKIQQSIALFRDEAKDYEFRTTAACLHGLKELMAGCADEILLRDA